MERVCRKRRGQKKAWKMLIFFWILEWKFLVVVACIIQSVLNKRYENQLIIALFKLRTRRFNCINSKNVGKEMLDDMMKVVHTKFI